MAIPAFPTDKQVEVFYDGDCPLCMKEIRMLQRLDRRRGRIAFTNIADPDFDASAYGRTQDHFMGSIQGREGEGRWIEGVEVFRQLYAAVGLGLPARLSRLPGIAQALDAGYRVFSRNRLWLTGRNAESCETDRCAPRPQPVR